MIHSQTHRKWKNVGKTNAATMELHHVIGSSGEELSVPTRASIQIAPSESEMVCD